MKQSCIDERLYFTVSFFVISLCDVQLTSFAESKHHQKSTSCEVLFLGVGVHKGFDENLFSVILPGGRVIFSLCESVIETLSFSYILFANKLAKQITLCKAQ